MKIFTKAKAKVCAMVVAVVSVLATTCAMAESASGTANAATVTAMTGVANDMVATIQAIIPIALTVVGIGLVVMAGIRIFRKIAKPS
jgi:hypothetical protein